MHHFCRSFRTSGISSDCFFVYPLNSGYLVKKGKRGKGRISHHCVFPRLKPIATKDKLNSFYYRKNGIELIGFVLLLVFVLMRFRFLGFCGKWSTPARDYPVLWMKCEAAARRERVANETDARQVGRSVGCGGTMTKRTNRPLRALSLSLSPTLAIDCFVFSVGRPVEYYHGPAERCRRLQLAPLTEVCEPRRRNV